MVFEACELRRFAEEFNLARSTVELLWLSKKITQAHTVGGCRAVLCFQTWAEILLLIWSYRFICDAHQLLIIKLKTHMVTKFSQAPLFQTRNLRLNNWSTRLGQHVSSRCLIVVDHLLCFGI